MKIQDVLYYAPNFKLAYLATATSSDIVNAFESRISEYYFKAAEILNNQKSAFGAGDICFDAIDAIARFEFGSGGVGERFKKWISRLPDFKALPRNEIEGVYDDFRNGITHEARIKNGGQFSYEIGRSIYVENGIIVINPSLLLNQIRHEFARFMEDVKSDSYATERLANSIRHDFREDLEMLERNAVAS